MSSSSEARSRTGCGTCKARKKKCDERWDEAGRCDRCVTGRFTCSKLMVVPERRRRRSARTVIPTQVDSPTNSASSTSPALSNLARNNNTTISAIDPHETDSPTLQLAPAPTRLLDDFDLITSMFPSNDAGSLAPASQDTVTDTDTAWQKLLDWLDPDVSADLELRQFSVDWWGFYASITDNWFSSLPKRVRIQLVESYRGVVAQNELGRAALASLCASHFAFHLPAEDVRQREWQLKADQYFDQCMRMLASGSPYPLDVLLPVILDLRLAKLESQGAVTGNLLLDTASLYLRRAALTLDINLGLSVSFDRLPTHVFAYSDVLQSVSTFNRSTILNISYQLPENAAVGDPDGTAVVAHLGLPGNILALFGSIANLTCIRKDLEPLEFQIRTSLLEEAVKTARSRLPVDEGLEGIALLSQVAVQEMWKQALVIFFYASLLQKGPLATTLQSALQQMISISTSLDDESLKKASIFSKAALSCPWFLAATVAITAESREICREGLEDCGSGKVHKENLAAIEKLWSVADEVGVVPDWREFVATAGLPVSFL